MVNDYHTIRGVDDMPVPSGVAQPERGFENTRISGLDELARDSQAGGSRRHHRRSTRRNRTRRSRGYRMRRVTQRQLKQQRKHR